MIIALARSIRTSKRTHIYIFFFSSKVIYSKVIYRPTQPLTSRFQIKRSSPSWLWLRCNTHGVTIVRTSRSDVHRFRVDGTPRMAPRFRVPIAWNTTPPFTRMGSSLPAPVCRSGQRGCTTWGIQLDFRTETIFTSRLKTKETLLSSIRSSRNSNFQRWMIVRNDFLSGDNWEDFR